YYVEVRNRTTDRTIYDVIVTWDETPFTRLMDKKHSRDCLLSPTSIAPSSSVSVFLFSVEDDLQIVRHKNDVVGLASVFTLQASGREKDEATARFKYEPDKSPKLRMAWR